MIGPTSPTCGESVTQSRSISRYHLNVSHILSAAGPKTPSRRTTVTCGKHATRRIATRRCAQMPLADRRHAGASSVREHGPVGGIGTHTRTRHVATVGDTVPDSATVVDRRSDTLAARVAAAAAASPDKTALIWHDTMLRWGELDRRVDAAAAALIGYNLPTGARVALALPNSPRYAVTLLRRAARGTGRGAGQPVVHRPRTAPRARRFGFVAAGRQPRRGPGGRGHPGRPARVGARTRETARRRPARRAAGRRR